MGVMPGAPGPRGVLRPGPHPEDALHCEVCGGWFVPTDNFGCPGCAQQREMADVAEHLERRLLIQRFSRFELKDLGYDDG